MADRPSDLFILIWYKPTRLNIKNFEYINQRFTAIFDNKPKSLNQIKFDKALANDFVND